MTYPKKTPSFQSLVFDWDILKLVAEYCGAARFACLPQNCTMDGCGGSLRHDRLRYTRIEKNVNKISRFDMCPTVIKVYLFVSNSTVAIGSSSLFVVLTTESGKPKLEHMFLILSYEIRNKRQYCVFLKNLHLCGTRMNSSHKNPVG